MQIIRILASLAALTVSSHALEWNDNSVGFRYGTEFAEPYGSDDIAKGIFHFTHASGYKYGTNFFNLDYLVSNDDDPRDPGSSDGAQEFYVVYRHTLDLGKASGQDLKWGPIRGCGLTAGFDWNHKDDAAYNSRKQMIVLGPTLMIDVPGFLNISLLALWESNAPYNGFSDVETDRYTYDTHPALCLNWGIPFKLGPVPLSFEGYANFIASKGDDEFGDGTAPETNIDMQLMYDAGSLMGLEKNHLKIGLEYQFWRNKFGNDHKGPAGDGAFANTPMIRMEYHF
jgi:nucleoside-specific outer membrane channel protein Tsx